MSDAQPETVEWTASSRTGAIAVRTTEQGLPLGISIDPSDLRRDPQELAGEVLRLCKNSASRAALARRAQLEAAGAPPDMLALMGLPTPEQVARQEMSEEAEYETEPVSWLRQV